MPPGEEGLADAFSDLGLVGAWLLVGESRLAGAARLEPLDASLTCQHEAREAIVDPPREARLRHDLDRSMAAIDGRDEEEASTDAPARGPLQEVHVDLELETAIDETRFVESLELVPREQDGLQLLDQDFALLLLEAIDTAEDRAGPAVDDRRHGDGEFPPIARTLPKTLSEPVSVRGPAHVQACAW
jgi:hypothetical protein